MWKSHKIWYLRIQPKQNWVRKSGKVQEIGRRAKDHLPISYTYYHDNSKHACMHNKKSNQGNSTWQELIHQNCGGTCISCWIDFHLPPYHKRLIKLLWLLYYIFPDVLNKYISHILPPVHNVNCALVGYVGKQGTLLETYLVQEILEKTMVLGITCLEEQKKVPWWMEVLWFSLHLQKWNHQWLWIFAGDCMAIHRSVVVLGLLDFGSLFDIHLPVTPPL